MVDSWLDRTVSQPESLALPGQAVIDASLTRGTRESRMELNLVFHIRESRLREFRLQESNY
jgi:hypothetical protein